MKKLLTIFLCLMLILPLDAFAEETVIQPQTQTETQAPETQPPENKPAETQPAETKPAESKPAETQPAETQPAETQPVQTPPSDHTHVWDVSYTVPATCKEEGATAYGCSACGAISVEVLPKLTTHTYDNACDPDCNVCGITREITHNFSTQWSRNSSGHWHACTVCGEQRDFGKHFAGPAATEEKAQLCLTCGITLTAKLNHSHKYETQWTSDETGHWYICTGCEERKDFTAHSFDNGCDPDCNVCGYTTSAAHSYSGTWSSDETSHWDVCTICQEESVHEAHIPGPEATEEDPQICTACGFELAAALDQHVHEGEGEWLTDAEDHWKLCACGEETELTPHNWDEGEEQEDTTILYTCLDCGFTRTEGEPKTPGRSPLIWLGAAIFTLLAAAAVIVFFLISKVNKGGKHVR